MIYLAVLCGILVVIILIILLWLAFSLSAAYQQTLTVDVPFVDTFRYIPHLNTEKRYPLDKIKVDVTGTLKKDSDTLSTVTPSSRVHDFIKTQLVNSYENCLLMHESHTFDIADEVLGEHKRCPLSVHPTAENLAILFFNKLAPLMPEIGCQLVSVKIVSGTTKVTHSRYKISDYRV